MRWLTLSSSVGLFLVSAALLFACPWSAAAASSAVDRMLCVANASSASDFMRLSHAASKSCQLERLFLEISPQGCCVLLGAACDEAGFVCACAVHLACLYEETTAYSVASKRSWLTDKVPGSDSASNTIDGVVRKTIRAGLRSFTNASTPFYLDNRSSNYWRSHYCKAIVSCYTVSPLTSSVSLHTASRCVSERAFAAVLPSLINSPPATLLTFLQRKTKSTARAPHISSIVKVPKLNYITP